MKNKVKLKRKVVNCGEAYRLSLHIEELFKKEDINGLLSLNLSEYNYLNEGFRIVLRKYINDLLDILNEFGDVDRLKMERY